MRSLIFDLDGTLADTSGDLIAAANAALQEMGMGMPLRAPGDDATAFAGGRAMLRLGLARSAPSLDEAARAALVERGYPRLLLAYGAAIDRHTRLYPGVEAALDRLGAAGWGLAICTNKPEALAVELVARLGIADRFGALVGADTLPLRKPDPAPLREAIARIGGSTGRAALVGDTVTDRETARAAGLPAILVTFGPTGGAVAALGPEGLLEHYDHIEAVAEPLVR
ncbi:MAG: HAD-IA family hydrolase [Rhodobacteraceae bacterium]|nr:HAD-IA family hydrolase [Paracoccaceae bacterium]